jgi:hypothetical protein
MTDVEITEACAEAMEDPATLPGSSNIWGVSKTFINGETEVSSWVKSTYDPLHDDAQAMALVKKFNLDIYAPHHGFGWTVGTPSITRIENEDLNRAICECVARLKER